MHGCGWDSGAARERCSAHWLPASPRVTRSAPMAWALRARAPAVAWSAPRATRSAPMALPLRARAPTVHPSRYLRTLVLGGGDVEDVVRSALLETLVATRVSSSCQGQGWKGVVK